MKKFDLQQYLEDKINFQSVGLTQQDFKRFSDLKIKANYVQLVVMRDDLIKEIERRQRQWDSDVNFAAMSGIPIRINLNNALNVKGMIGEKIKNETERST